MITFLVMGNVKSKKQKWIILVGRRNMSAQDQIHNLVNNQCQDVVTFLFSKLELEPEKEQEMKNELSKKFGIFSSSSSSSSTKKKEETEAKNEKPKKPAGEKKAKKENGEKHQCSKMISPKGKKEVKQCSKAGTMERNGKWFCKPHYDKELENEADNDMKKESISEDEKEKDEEESPKTKPESEKKKEEKTSKLKIGEGLKTEKKGDYTVLKGTLVVLDKNLKALGTLSKTNVLQNGVFSENDKKMLNVNNIEIIEEDDL
jgi:hypothetical protein